MGPPVGDPVDVGQLHTHFDKVFSHASNSTTRTFTLVKRNLHHTTRAG